MALSLRIREDELSKLDCQPDSPVGLFWAKFADRRPLAVPNMAEVCAKIAYCVENNYCADTVQDMPNMMTEQQLQQVMAEADGKATWSGMITHILGPFKPSVTAVDIAKLPLPPSAVMLPPIKAEPTYEILPLGRDMEMDGTLADDVIPEYVFDAVFECEDPNNQELSAKDVTAVLNAYTHWMITTHKQPAGDKIMRVWHGKQLKRRLKHLPTHGNTPGPMRKWCKLLSERKRNLGRKNSNVCGRILTRTCPHTITQQQLRPTAAAPGCKLTCIARVVQILESITFTSKEVDENMGVAAIKARVPDFKPVIDDRKKRDLTRLPLSQLHTHVAADSLLACTAYDDGSPPGDSPPGDSPPAAVKAITQADRDKAQKAQSAAAAVAALDHYDDDDYLFAPSDGHEEPEEPPQQSDGVVESATEGDEQRKKAPTAKERRAKLAAAKKEEKAKEKAAKDAEKKQLKEAKEAEKAAKAAAAQGSGKRKRQVPHSLKHNTNTPCNTLCNPLCNPLPRAHYVTMGYSPYPW